MGTDDIQTGELNADEKEVEVTRRNMIKLGVSAVVASTLIGVEGNVLAQAVQNKTPLFFTKDEFALVDELTELIIPTDDHSPGARAAQVASYIDFRLSESFDVRPKTQWREGLKLIQQLSQEMHGKAFLESSLDQQIALLTRISQNETKAVKPEELFFRELKTRTVQAYYSSKIGIHDEIEYKGNTSLKEFVGFDVS